MARSISKRKRFSIFQRDSFTCQYCGRRPPEVMLQVDHIVPSSKGGSDAATNLITSCFDCNSGKSDISLEAVPDSLIEIQTRRIEALEQATALQKLERRYAKLIDEQVLRIEAEFLQSNYRFKPPERRSLRMFLQKLGYDAILDAMNTAQAKHDINGDSGWRYFCGICWNQIRAREAPDDD